VAGTTPELNNKKPHPEKEEALKWYVVFLNIRMTESHAFKALRRLQTGKCQLEDG